ncbi:MAG: succinate dehydrogenase [Myxococcota bacterium]
MTTTHALHATPERRLAWHFLLRRLHSLSGMLSLGAFMVLHLWGLSRMAYGGPEAYNVVAAARRSAAYLVLEALLVGIPLIFHAVYGLIITRDARPNVGTFPTWSNWVFVLMRVTGVIALVFVVVHFFNTRVQELFLGREIDAAFMQRVLRPIPMLDFYILGVMACAFHLAAGTWSFLIRWGITITARSQRVAAVLCGTFGLLLTALGVHVAAAFHDPKYIIP